MFQAAPIAIIFATCVIALCGCSHDAATSDVPDATTSLDTGPLDASDPDVDAPPNPDIAGDPACDPLVPTVCAMPWPSSYFLAEDPTTATGFRLALSATTLPANVDGMHVDPTPHERLDGFSVAAPLVMHFPTLDPTSVPDENALAESLADDSPIVVLEVSSDGSAVKRIPAWGEVDLSEPDESRRAFFIRPAVLLAEGRRYVVGIRGLKARDGSDIVPSPAFQALVSGTTAGTGLAERQARFDEVFAFLEAEGVAKEELVLAWDFVTASSESIHGDVLHIRDRAFEWSDANGISFSIERIEETSVDEDAHIAFEILGTFEVPWFHEDVEVVNTTWTNFKRGPDGKPQQNGTRQAEFRARIPHSALDGTPHGVLMHGHGLLGTHGQIRADFYAELANTENLIIVGCNMTGMAEEDVPAITNMIYDFSHFRGLPERVQQGLIEHLLLVRGMRDTFDLLPEIVARNVAIDDGALYYSGISQGGIYGASLMALSQDMTRGHLGVPGSNYSLLLMRSVDFEEFLALLTIFYPDSRDRALMLSVIQSLWDSADPATYLRHIRSEPFPDTPPHDVLLVSATGDWQVALVSNEVAVRSDVGVALMPDYGKDVPLVSATPYPHKGSALVNYDFGNPWPAPGPVPPNDELGDPHSKPRRLPWHNQQMMHFLRTGEVIDVCGGDGCNPD